jgi:hypothetical protein
MARPERLFVPCLALLVIVGCKSRSSAPVSTSAATPAQSDARNALILINKPQMINGDAESAATVEQWPSKGTLDSIEKIEIAVLTANGWSPLKKNAVKWKAHPVTYGRMLGYKKNSLYYVMFIRPASESKEQPVRVVHVVAHKLPLTDSSDYFLP